VVSLLELLTNKELQTAELRANLRFNTKAYHRKLYLLQALAVTAEACTRLPSTR
jgi:tRNA G18 (ribose-2'-O)-methylase SpoU